MDALGAQHYDSRDLAKWSIKHLVWNTRILQFLVFGYLVRINKLMIVLKIKEN